MVEWRGGGLEERKEVDSHSVSQGRTEGRLEGRGAALCFWEVAVTGVCHKIFLDLPR